MIKTSKRVRTYIITLVHIQIGVHIALMGSINCTRHAWPSLLEGEHALDIVAMNFFSGHRIDDGGLDAEEWE